MRTSSNQIQWITQDQSYAFYDDNYRPKKLAMEAAVVIETENRKVWRFLPGTGTVVEIDGLGSFQQWYGILDQELFIISLSNDTYQFGEIQVPVAPLEESDDWSPVEIVACLSKGLISSISWIRSKGTGEYSLFYRERDVIESLFCNTTIENAEKLQRFLEQQSSSIETVVALSEEFFSHWTGYKITARGEEFICGYPDRGTTEQFVNSQKINNPDAKFKITPDKNSIEHTWRLMKQDDNNIEIEMAAFSNQVDAKFAQLDYEKRGQKQIYWVEQISLAL